MARKRPRYAWALHFTESDPEIEALSEHDRWGWRFACEFAKAAIERSKQALRDVHGSRLTAAEVGRPYGLSFFQVNEMVRSARLELFGRAQTDSGIYYRLRRRKEGHAWKGPRTCGEDGCEVELGRHAHGNRLYCRAHRGGAARIRRHRRTAVRAVAELPTAT